MTVIVGSPPMVRAGANQLQQASRELTETGRAVAGAAGSVTTAWSGPAAVAFGGAAQRTEQACLATGARLAEVAEASTRYADRLQAAQTELARLTQRQARLGEQELLLRVKAAAAVPVHSELADVTAARTQLGAAADEIVRRHDLERAAFEAALTAAPPVVTLGDVAGVSRADWTFLGQAKKEAGKGATVLRNIAHTVGAFRAQAAITAIHRLPWPLTEAAAAELAAKEKTLAAASKAVIGTAVPGSVPQGLVDKFGAVKSLGGRASLLMTIKDGVSDLVTGEPDHPGVRNVATRVAGAAGATGGVILLASATNPVGMALITGYGAYKVGTWVYDHREDIKRVATNAWRRVAPVLAAGRDAVAEKAGQVRDAAGAAVGRAVSDAGGAVRDKATEIGGRLGSGLRTLVARPRFGW